MQLDAGFDLLVHQKGHFEPGFGNPGGTDVVSRNPGHLAFGQSPAEIRPKKSQCVACIWHHAMYAESCCLSQRGLKE
jgi:hypothetical protein